MRLQITRYKQLNQAAHKDRLYLAGQFTAVRTIAMMRETLIY